MPLPIHIFSGWSNKNENLLSFVIIFSNETRLRFNMNNEQHNTKFLQYAKSSLCVFYVSIKHLLSYNVLLTQLLLHIYIIMGNRTIVFKTRLDIIPASYLIPGLTGRTIDVPWNIEPCPSLLCQVSTALLLPSFPLKPQIFSTKSSFRIKWWLWRPTLGLDDHP